MPAFNLTLEGEGGLDLVGVFDLDLLGVPDLRESPEPSRFSPEALGVGSSMIGARSGPTSRGSNLSSTEQ